ncbi:MAG: DNA recombination protein RmuC [Bacteroidota bacterium]|jgi:DNA recombination protein RmuC
MEIVLLIAGIVIGYLIARLLHKQGTPADAQLLSQLQNEKAALEATATVLQQERQYTVAQQQELNTKLLQATADASRFESEVKQLQQKLVEQAMHLDQLNERFKQEFENLANKILEEKSQKFTDQNRTNLDVILQPLKERIKEFEEKVQRVYDVEAAERNTLKGEIKQLLSLNQVMHQEAQNLTKALKGDTKTQGNWGEFILESILEKSGLQKGREYLTQSSASTEDGKRLQPDVLVNLPDGKTLVIDSKVSLVAYERYINADDDTVKAVAIKEHIQSVRNHVKGLSDKNYQQLYSGRSLDFVLLFIAVEPAFAAAVQHDGQLFTDAFEKNIVIVSPTTLLATLRTVSNIWRHEYQNRNAMEIAHKAGDLYDKFHGFTTDMIDIGKKMDQSKAIYEDAMKKLTSGNGNILRKVEELKKMGASASKQLPQNLLDRSMDE